MHNNKFLLFLTMVVAMAGLFMAPAAGAVVCPEDDGVCDEGSAENVSGCCDIFDNDWIIEVDSQNGAWPWIDADDKIHNTYRVSPQGRTSGDNMYDMLLQIGVMIVGGDGNPLEPGTATFCHLGENDETQFLFRITANPDPSDGSLRFDIVTIATKVKKNAVSLKYGKKCSGVVVLGPSISGADDIQTTGGAYTTIANGTPYKIEWKLDIAGNVIQVLANGVDITAQGKPIEDFYFCSPPDTGTPSWPDPPDVGNYECKQLSAVSTRAAFRSLNPTCEVEIGGRLYNFCQ